MVVVLRDQPPSQDESRRAARASAEDGVCERGDLQQCVNRAQKNDEERRKKRQKRDAWSGMGPQKSSQDIADDIDNSRSHDLIKRELQESLEPPPEKPIK